MVDTPKEVTDSLNAATKAAHGLSDSISEGAKKLHEWMADLGSYASTAVNGFVNISESLSKLVGNIGKASSAYSDLNSDLSKTVNMTGELYSLLSKRDPFANFGSQGGAAAASLSESFGTIAPVIDKIIGSTKALGLPHGFIDKLKGLGPAFFEGADQAQHLENRMLSLASASGDLEKMYDKAGTGLANITELDKLYESRIEKSAQANNVSTKEAHAYADALGSLPGFLTSNIQVTDKGNKSLDQLTATMRIAKGAQIDLATTTSLLDTAYDKLGNGYGEVNDATEKGNKLIAITTTTAQDLNMRFKDTQHYLEVIADAFKNTGDNTEAATKILGRYMDALRGTGLTTKESTNLVEGMVKSLGHLSVGTKALISLRSGGPGGLQGAFKIDELIRNGKLDEVQRMMEKALKQQFGGRIYSQAEAAASPQAAAQFYRQSQFLQSGAFGSLVHSQEDATRLLEAMKSGKVLDKAGIQGSTEAMRHVLGRGGEIQSRQYNGLISMTNDLDQQAANKRIGQLQISRDNFGADGRQTMMAAEAEGSRLRENMSMAQTGIALGRSNQLAINKSMADLVHLSGEITTGFKKLISTEGSILTGGFKEILKDVAKSTHEIRQQKELNSGQAKTNHMVIEVKVESTDPHVKASLIKSSMSATNSSGNAGGVVTVVNKG